MEDDRQDRSREQVEDAIGEVTIPRPRAITPFGSRPTELRRPPALQQTNEQDVPNVVKEARHVPQPARIDRSRSVTLPAVKPLSTPSSEPTRGGTSNVVNDQEQRFHTRRPTEPTQTPNVVNNRQGSPVRRGGDGMDDAILEDIVGPKLTRVAEIQRPTGPSPQALQAIRKAAKDRVGARGKAEGSVPGGGSVPSRESVSVVARKHTTVSRVTLEQYLRRGNQLFARYCRELELDLTADEAPPVDFVNWLLSLKPDLKSATWRAYRQAAYHWLEGSPSHDAPQARDLLDGDVIERSRPLREDDRKPSGNGEKRTSALKEKRLPFADYDRIVTFLAKFSKSRVAPYLIDWLQAGLLTGLRPVEWRATDMQISDAPETPSGKRIYLYVINAKATNERGTGVARTLDLSDFKDDEIAAVRRMSQIGRKWFASGAYADMQGQCSALMYDVTERLWPNRRYAYSLYSTRHQAIATWKANMDLPSIAAMVGHGVTATASERYGKRRSAWDPEVMPSIPVPVPEELAIIKHRIRMYDDRIKIEIKAGIRSESDLKMFPVG